MESEIPSESTESTSALKKDKCEEAVEYTEGHAAQMHESQGSDDVESSDEEIILDELSDTENYTLPMESASDKDAEDDGDVSCSSGEEEEGVAIAEVRVGGVKFHKLKFKDVEEKRAEIMGEMKSMSEEDSEENEEKCENANEETKEQEEQTTSFKGYRTDMLLDENMEDYKSDDDDDFNPVYCGETLSDVEYSEGDERDTESEPDTEEMDGSHKKTGETLVCIKMIKELQIPPRGELCSSQLESVVQSPEHAMECT